MSFVNTDAEENLISAIRYNSSEIKFEDSLFCSLIKNEGNEFLFYEEFVSVEIAKSENKFLIWMLVKYDKPIYEKAYNMLDDYIQSEMAKRGITWWKNKTEYLQSKGLF